MKIATAAIALLLLAACAKTEPTTTTTVTSAVTKNSTTSQASSVGPSGTLDEIASGKWKLIDHEKYQKPLLLSFHSYTPDGDESTNGIVDGTFGAPGMKDKVAEMKWKYLEAGKISITNIQGNVRFCNMQISGSEMDLYCDSWGNMTKMRYAKI